MIIKKYFHSCLLLEENGKRLLIDPGKFSFGEDGVTVEEVGPVDVIFITHEHADHFLPDVLRDFQKSGSCRIVTHEAIGVLLQEQGIEHELIAADEEKIIADFSVKGIPATHGPLPVPIPDNFMYLINERILHPGDSYEVTSVDCEVLALPVVAPWAKLTETVDYALAVKAKKVIPIHDAFLKDYMRMAPYYAVTQKKLKEAGIEFHPLELGDQLEV